MRAWTIVLFLISIHACLFIFGSAQITSSMGYNWSLDTSDRSGNIRVIPGANNVTLPSSDPFFFDESANSSNIRGNGSLDVADFSGSFIESVVGVGGTLNKMMGMFSRAIFGIHSLAAPYFGEGPAWILEFFADAILAIGVFQIVTGRSFKAAD